MRVRESAPRWPKGVAAAITALSLALAIGACGDDEPDLAVFCERLALASAPTGAVTAVDLEDPDTIEAAVAELDALVESSPEELRADVELMRDSFERLEVHSYAGEGWGLCSDGHDLFMSDGSARITRRDPEDFSVLGQVEVRDMGQPVARLNELECVDDLVYANVWKTDEILRIDRRSGSVLARIDASGLRPASATNREAVLNGIAWDAASQTFLITGKWWDLMYRVRFVPASAAPIHLPLLRQGG